MKLYMAVTRDKYELPLAVEQTATELAKVLGVRGDTVVKGILRGRKGYAVVDVDVEEWEVIAKRTCQMCGRELEDQVNPGRLYCYECGKKRIALRRRAR